MNNPTVRSAVIGCGRMARGHVRRMLTQPEQNRVVVVSEPSTEAYDAMRQIFAECGQPAPPNEPELLRLLDSYAGQLDAAFIITPHVYHYQQAKSCLEAGLDVLLEKPMVVNVQEAVDLIAARDRAQKLLVIAFNGSLSPRIRQASAMIASGDAGAIQGIVALIWEDWKQKYTGHWKQDPPISGGGFMFDTGAHMMNTVADLANQEFVEIAAWLNFQDRPVDIVGAVIGRLASGALVTMHACGETIPAVASDIRVYGTKAIIRTGAWGEFLEIQRAGESSYTPVELVSPPSPWEQFLAVRAGNIANPSPPEIGLRMAKVWDAIQASARQNGQPVSI